MSMLYVPVDFERLPEYRSLQSLLLVKLSALGKPGHAESLATFIFFRLWVDLSYQAQVTKPLGALPESAVPLFLNSLGAEISQLEPMALLVKSGMLKPEGEHGTNGTDGTYICERFAKCNPHLSPDFRSGQLKGAEHSAYTRGKKKVEQEAMQQSLMLEAAVLKRRNGELLQGKDVNRVLILIRTLDNCLRLPPRNKSHVTEGLIADAAQVMDSYSPEQLEATYLWIIDHRDHPALPKTTEQLLADFGSLAKVAATASL